MENQYQIERRELIDWLALQGDETLILCRTTWLELSFVDDKLDATAAHAISSAVRAAPQLFGATTNSTIAEDPSSPLYCPSRSSPSCGRPQMYAHPYLCCFIIIMKRQSIQVNGLRWY